MVTSQKCIKCNKQKKITAFYTHRDNKAWNLHDCICSSCVKNMVDSKETMQEYCKTSKRVFREDLWEWAENKAKSIFEHDIEFNSLEEEERNKKFLGRVISGYFGQMNQSQYYSMITFSEEELSQMKQVEIDETESLDNEDELEDTLDKKEKRVRSVEWGGTYSRSQLDYLQSYFADSCGDFKIVTRNHRDYLYKIAKSSLAMDEAFNDMLQGKPGADKKYAAAKTVFDSLSQSAKFSEKTRSANDVAGYSSLSEVVAQLEKSGFLKTPKTFEQDDIDKIGNNFRHTIVSVGGAF